MLRTVNNLVQYIDGAQSSAFHFDEMFQTLMNELDWVKHPSSPRMEYYWNRFNEPYSYGKGEFARTFMPQPLHPVIEKIKRQAELAAKTEFDTCFMNLYRDGTDHLGWHSDNSPEMDDARPIAIVSLGAERQLWFREIPKEKGAEGEVTKLQLRHGSLCLMSPGMQDTHQHRVPKSDRECGPRISLTFRGYVQAK